MNGHLLHRIDIHISLWGHCLAYYAIVPLSLTNTPLEFIFPMFVRIPYGNNYELKESGHK